MPEMVQLTNADKEGYYTIVNLPHKGPRAVLSINFAPDAPQGFATGQFYALKVLRVKDKTVDFGFVLLEVKTD